MNRNILSIASTKFRSRAYGKDWWDGPERVMITQEGEATSPIRAALSHQIYATVAFVRSDGWILGAPPQYEHLAYQLWEHSWVGWARSPSYEFFPMAEYTPVGEVQ